MYLEKKEIPKILAYYRVDNLGLVFDGFEKINPDGFLYYFHDPKNDDLYALLLTDYVGWGMGNKEPDERIFDDYYAGHECDWNVEKWLTCRDELVEMPDDADYEGWFYWPECGEKCVFAKLKYRAEELRGRKLEQDLPDNSDGMVDRKSSIIIDNERPQ